MGIVICSFPLVLSGSPKTKSKTMPIALLPIKRRNFFNSHPDSSWAAYERGQDFSFFISAVMAGTI